jgi:hypothetical protein
MSSVNGFAAAAARIGDTPPPFREILWQRIPKAEAVRQLIFSPAFVAGKFQALASVLCVTDRRWLVLLGQNDGRITVDEAVYDTTLLVELTIILLYGQVKIHFVANRETGRRHFTLIQLCSGPTPAQFRSFWTRLTGRSMPRRSPMISGWPLKFRNFAIIYVPEKSQLLDGVCWKEIRGSFNRELGPAAALVLTDRHIVLIAEEKGTGWFQIRQQAKHGAVMTYFPTNLVTKRQVLIARWIVRIDPVTNKRTLISKWGVARCAAPTARPKRVKCITCATTEAGPIGPRYCRSVTGAIQRVKKMEPPTGDPKPDLLRSVAAAAR